MRTSRPPLPEGWSEAALVEDVVLADGVSLRRAGWSSTGPQRQEVTGAAVEVETSPIARGHFELLERVSTLEALATPRPYCELRTAEGCHVGERPWDQVFPESDDPARWRYARSNGIALHADWETAALRAFWELAERDRVLRAWYGETRPEPIVFGVEGTPLGGALSYDWVASAFPQGEATFSSGVEVVGVFGFPVSASLPLVFGYGARATRSDALDAAVRESLQLLGFLWGESLLDELPEPTPTPMHHLEYFQRQGHHGALRTWLADGHGQVASKVANKRTEACRRGGSDVLFVDLTPSWLGAGLRVAKAVCDAATPLAFGQIPFTEHLPSELRVHPIA